MQIIYRDAALLHHCHLMEPLHLASHPEVSRGGPRWRRDPLFIFLIRTAALERVGENKELRGD